MKCEIKNKNSRHCEERRDVAICMERPKYYFVHC